EIDVAEGEAHVVGEFVDDGVVVHGGAAGRVILEEVDAASAEPAQRMVTGGPYHKVDDVAGLLDDVVAGARAVEIPEHLVRQVAGVTVGLQEQHFANTAI